MSEKQPEQEAFAILGSGICGLALGNLMLEAYPDAKVTIYSDEKTDIVSRVASAQFYPIWLGDNLPPGYDEQLRTWFLASKRRFLADSALGLAVHHTPNHELFTEKPTPPGYFYDVLSNFKQQADDNLPDPYTHSFTFDTMIIDPLRYIPQISQRFDDAGGKRVRIHINSIQDVLDLPEEKIFNCLGLGSGAIFDDPTLKPVKGISLRLPFLPELQCAVSAGDFVLAPRGNETFMGAPYLESWKTLEPTDDEIDYMWDGVTNIVETSGNPFSLPKGTLKKGEIIEVRSGLRPVRDGGPRVEIQNIGDKTIIHNYGHGGNGVILSWGTAEHAIQLAMGS